MRIRVFRPFPKDEVRRVSKGVKKIGVVDRNISFGSEGIFFQEVKSALCNEEKRVPVYGFVAGLGGRDVEIDDFEDIIEDIIKREKASDIKWVGLKK